MLFKCAPLPCTARDACLYTVLQELESCGADLECLVGHLHEKAAAITAVKKIVREQMDLVTHYRNTVIAVLVALYVPISFVSVSLTSWTSSGARLRETVLPGNEHHRPLSQSLLA